MEGFWHRGTTYYIYFRQPTLTAGCFAKIIYVEATENCAEATRNKCHRRRTHPRLPGSSPPLITFITSLEFCLIIIGQTDTNMADPHLHLPALPQFSSRVALSLPLPRLLYSGDRRQHTTHSTKPVSTGQISDYELETWPDFRIWVMQAVAELGMGADPGPDLSPRINTPSGQGSFLVGNENGSLAVLSRTCALLSTKSTRPCR